jgi:hypothetical protein
VESEFIDNLKSLFGLGLFGELKNKLIPLSLEVLKLSLLGHTHPFETIRGLGDHQWEDLLDNPHTPSLVNKLLDDLEQNPKMQPLMQTLHHPEVLKRLRVEWLYEMTAGRFDRTVPYLYKEDELTRLWKEFCHELKDISFKPYEYCEEMAQKALQLKGGGLSESSKRLFIQSYLAVCRKLFVFFTGARETWIGSYSNESFKLTSQAADLISSRGQRVERLVLKFGLVDHVFYLSPLLEQLNRFKECIAQFDLVFEIQKKMCPFVSLAGTGLNFNLMAEVFYRIYQPQRVKELRSPEKSDIPEAFLRDVGLPKSLAIQLGFMPISQDVVDYFQSKIISLPRLHPFLHNPRTERGLLRQRLYKGVLDQLLTSVTQETLLALCWQWNPYIRTPEGTTVALMNYVEANVKLPKEATNISDSARRKAMLDDLLLLLLQNTQGWQKLMEKDSFVIDIGRNFFMSVLNKAIEEHGSEEMKRINYRDTARVVCVVAT